MAPSGVIAIKSPEAFRTISEVAAMLDVPQHVLRFWETRFPQIKPIKRAGGRRFYRPEDVDLLRGIQLLLYYEGYTIRGAQKVLREKGVRYTASLGREQAKNGHAAREPKEIARLIEESGFDAFAYARGDEAEMLAQEKDAAAILPDPVDLAAPAENIAGQAEEIVEPAESPRRARLKALRAELQELKSRLTNAHRRLTA